MRENCTYGSMRGRAFPTGRPALLYTPLKLDPIEARGDNVARNVAAVSVLLFGSAGVVLMFWSPMKESAVNTLLFEHWKYLTPLITASLDYLFGQMRVSKLEAS